MQKHIRTIILFITFILSSLIGNYIILKSFPYRVVSPDLIFTLFPYDLKLEYITDILFIIAVLLFIFFYVVPNIKKLEQIFDMILLMYILRALIMVFTPLMRPTGVDLPSHGIFRDFITQLGMFPSGHIALIATMYFQIEGKKYEVLRKLYLPLLIVISFLMILSRGHYTIDVIGGIMLSYIVVHEYKKHI